MVDAAGLERIEQQVASSELAATLQQKLLGWADLRLTQPVSTYEFPDGRTLLLVTREVQRRSVMLSLAHRLTGDERYAARAYAELEAAAQFPDWNPESWLSVAELLYAFAVGYDWLYDYLTDDQRTVVREAMVNHGLNQATVAYDRREWWVDSTTNWNVVCNSGVIVAALAVGHDEPELANALLHRAYGSLANGLSAYGPDGGYPEGSTYWAYATRFLVSALSSLDTAIGDDYGVADAPGLDVTVDFSMQLCGTSGQQFNYADAVTAVRTRGGPAAAYWLAKRYDQPAYAWWADEGASRVPDDALPPLHLMWMGLIPPEDPRDSGLPLDKVFIRANVQTMRGGWESNDVFVGFRAGDNAANHGDLDMGTFVLDALGSRWAVELGRDDYGLPGYFNVAPDGERWTYYRKRAEGQNTLVLNPGAGPDQQLGATGRIVRTGGNADVAYTVAELSAAYADRGVSSWRRGIALIDGRSRVLVQDEASGEDPLTAYWFMHMHPSVVVDISADGRSAMLTLSRKLMLARLVDGPEGAQFSVTAAQPLSTSPNPPGQNPNTDQRKLTVALDGTERFRLAVLLEPLPAGHEAAPPPVVTDLAAWRLSTLSRRPRH